jgi:hypothetical protein
MHSTKSDLPRHSVQPPSQKKCVSLKPQENSQATPVNSEKALAAAMTPIVTPLNLAAQPAKSSSQVGQSST